VTGLRFELANRLNRRSVRHCGPELGDHVGSRGIAQLIAGNLFLPGELLADQFAHDS
jgi:hypothetical protein